MRLRSKAARVGEVGSVKAQPIRAADRREKFGGTRTNGGFFADQSEKRKKEYEAVIKVSMNSIPFLISSIVIARVWRCHWA